MHTLRIALVLLAANLVWMGAGLAEQQAIDPAKSTITVRVDKAGIFSVLGHDHTIAAPIAGGAADPAARQVSLRIQTGSLRVVDEKVSDKDREEIQRTMLGPDVLDAQTYPEILFQSTSAAPGRPGAWTVQGTLTLHGQARPVTVQVQERAGHYLGTARFRQTDFGIKPVRVAGGTVRVKDEIRIEFDIQLSR